MKITDKIIPDWIRRQASLEPNVPIDGEGDDTNYFWFLLTIYCPLIFQSYAILLTPFWINWKVKELVDSGTRMTEEQSANSDFKRLNWSAFFKIYLKEFNLRAPLKTLYSFPFPTLVSENLRLE